MAKWLPLSALVTVFLITANSAMDNQTTELIACSVVIGILAIIEYYLVVNIDDD